MREIIKFEKINKSFEEVRILSNISLSIYQGETLVLLGKSGSGKTTLLKLINGLIAPDSGRITINSKSAEEQDLTQLRREIGYVIQKIGLLPHLTVAQNMKVPSQIIGKPKDDHFYSTLLKQVGIDSDLLQQYPSQLSGGQQQRVGIARALVNDPAIILMDEPFSALDPLLRDQLQNDFLKIEKLKSKTIVMVTHDTEEAVKLGDRIALLHEGKLVQVGSPADLLFNPEQPFVADFFRKDAFALKLKLTKAKALGIEDEANPSIFELLAGDTFSADEKVAAINAYYKYEKKNSTQ